MDRYVENWRVVYNRSHFIRMATGVDCHSLGTLDPKELQNCTIDARRPWIETEQHENISQISSTYGYDLISARRRPPAGHPRHPGTVSWPHPYLPFFASSEAATVTCAHDAQVSSAISSSALVLRAAQAVCVGRHATVAERSCSSTPWRTNAGTSSSTIQVLATRYRATSKSSKPRATLTRPSVNTA